MNAMGINYPQSIDFMALSDDIIRLVLVEQRQLSEDDAPWMMSHRLKS